MHTRAIFIRPKFKFSFLISCIFYMVIKNEGRIGETRALLLLICRYGEKLHDGFKIRRYTGGSTSFIKRFHGGPSGIAIL